jgi:hypothetical protein
MILDNSVVLARKLLRKVVPDIVQGKADFSYL